MDEEQLKNFNEHLRNLNDILPILNKNLGEQTLLQTAESQADAQLQVAMNNLKNATASATTMFTSFGSAMLNSEKSFAKFGGSLSSAGDAALSLGKNFGILGLAFGALVKGATLVGEKMLEQADNTLKATDEVSNLGGAGAFTAKEVLDMGHRSGLTSKNLTVFTDAAKAAGTGLVTLGGNAASGVSEFAKMTAVTKDQRMAFQRLGVSQEELMLRQADYVKLQEVSGLAITKRMKQDGEVQRLSLDYAKSLTLISEITGRNAKEAAEGEKRAKASFDIQIHQNQLQNKEEKLRSQGNKEEADQLKKRRLIEDQLLNAAEQTGDADILAAAQSKIATGAYTESSSNLLRLGVDIDKVMNDNMKLTTKQIEQQGIAGDAAAEFGTQLKEGVRKNVDQLGEALVFSQDSAKQFGISQKTLAFEARTREQDLTKTYKDARERVGKPEKGKGTKKTEEDPAQIARNKMTESTIALTVAIDKAIADFNPLLSGMNKSTMTFMALAAAAVAASTALMGMAAKAGMSKIGEMAGGGKGGGGGGGPKGGAGKIGSAIKGVGGGAIANIAGVAGEYAGGKLKEAGHTRAGGAVSAAATAASWAGTGAMVGSVVPGVGTAIGAGIGFVAGAVMGLHENWDDISGKKDKDKDKKADDLLNFTNKSGSKENFLELSGGLQDSILAAAQTYKDATGKKLTINSAKREPEDQERLYDETVKANRPGIGPTGMPVGKPGASKHEQGEAVDIAQGKNDTDAISALSQAGLVQTVPKDPVHFEIPKARDGLITNGPDSGYLVEHHNLEMTAPLKQDSVLMELAKTSASSAAKENSAKLDKMQSANTNTSDNSESLSAIFNMMAEKLDNITHQLADAYTVQDKLLKVSRG